MTKLDQIRAAAEAATEGPWESVGYTVWCPKIGPASSICSCNCKKWNCGGDKPQQPLPTSINDMDFIVLARTAVPALCDALAEIQGCLIAFAESDSRYATVAKNGLANSNKILEGVG